MQDELTVLSLLVSPGLSPPSAYAGDTCQVPGSPSTRATLFSLGRRMGRAPQMWGSLPLCFGLRQSAVTWVCSQEMALGPLLSHAFPPATSLSGHQPCSQQSTRPGGPLPVLLWPTPSSSNSTPPLGHPPGRDPGLFPGRARALCLPCPELLTYSRPSVYWTERFLEDTTLTITVPGRWSPCLLRPLPPAAGLQGTCPTPSRYSLASYPGSLCPLHWSLSRGA